MLSNIGRNGMLEILTGEASKRYEKKNSETER